MSTWLLPESVADVLPSEARRIEELRRKVLDRYRVYGYELVMPPLLEYTESLLAGADQTLDLQTFKLLDQTSGRLLGLRADTTPQVARIDAHILNRQGATRLCYCGPVLHTQARGLHNTREPLQCGAELYGCEGAEADLEILSLACDTLALSGLQQYRLAFSHAGLLRAVLSGYSVTQSVQADIHHALAAKDTALITQLCEGLPEALRLAVIGMAGLYGPVQGEGNVLNKARALLPSNTEVEAILCQLEHLIVNLPKSVSAMPTLIADLADLASFEYHSDLIFNAYVDGCPNPVLRGGRYNDVGAAYGRARPATGFSVDLRELVSLRPAAAEPRSAVRAPWNADATLIHAVKALRDDGEVVVQTLPGTAGEEEEFVCDRELVLTANGWVVKPVQR